MKRFAMWVMSLLFPYRRPDRGLVSLAITISNSSRKP